MGRVVGAGTLAFFAFWGGTLALFRSPSDDGRRMRSSG
jgi:hypothetical protein